MHKDEVSGAISQVLGAIRLLYLQVLDNLRALASKYCLANIMREVF